MNKLEQSFADIQKRLGLTQIAVAYRGEKWPDYRFQATGHFDDAAPGQIPCAVAAGATINEAIAAMTVVLASKRSIALEGDDALWVEQEAA